MTDDFSNADVQALCARLGVETKTITDTFGRTHIALDEAGMRTLADHSPLGSEAAHAKLDRLLDALNNHYGT